MTRHLKIYILHTYIFLMTRHLKIYIIHTHIFFMTRHLKIYILHTYIFFMTRHLKIYILHTNIFLMTRHLKIYILNTDLLHLFFLKKKLLGKFLRIVRKSFILQLTLQQRREYEILEAVKNFRKNHRCLTRY